MTSLGRGSAFADMQLRHSFCEFGYLSRLVLVLADLRNGGDTLRWLSLLALPEP